MRAPPAGPWPDAADPVEVRCGCWGETGLTEESWQIEGLLLLAVCSGPAALGGGSCLCWEACPCLARQVETLTALYQGTCGLPCVPGSRESLVCGTVGTGLDLYREPVLSASLEAASGLCGAERGPGFPNFL